MKKVLFMLALVAIVFASCSKDKENDDLSRQMLGKWMMVQLNGCAVPTNERVVYTFESDTSGYLSASRVDYTEELPRWANHMPCQIELKGHDISMFGSFNKTTSIMAEIVVTSISENEMQTESRYSVYHNGELLYVKEGVMTWVKVPVDYGTDILGKWAGHVTSSEGSEFDDGEPHQWEYFDDGSYLYYSLDADSNWTSDVNAMSQYFVDGTLLCTRWKNTGEEEEHREWWEIASIENGVMNWTALRMRDDGTTYTATFSMTKVQPSRKD